MLKLEYLILNCCVAVVLITMSTTQQVEAEFGLCSERCACSLHKLRPGQILVAVANNPSGNWMTDVEKGFVSTVVEHE